MLLQKLTQSLREFERSMICYPHRVYDGFEYTEGVREMMTLSRCTWIVNRIFDLQHSEGSLKAIGVQCWDFKILRDHSVLLLCSDGAGHTVYYEHHAPVEYPKIELSFIFDRGLLKLKS